MLSFHPRNNERTNRNPEQTEQREKNWSEKVEIDFLMVKSDAATNFTGNTTLDARDVAREKKSEAIGSHVN